MSKKENEPLLQEDDNRFVMFPIATIPYGKCIKNR